VRESIDENEGISSLHVQLDGTLQSLDVVALGSRVVRRCIGVDEFDL